MNSNERCWELARLYIDVLRAKLDIVGQVRFQNIVYIQLYDSRTNTDPYIVLGDFPIYRSAPNTCKIHRKLENMMFRYKNGLRYKRWIEI